MNWADRALTIVASATITSAAWIVFGTMYVGMGSEGIDRTGASATPADDSTNPQETKDDGATASPPIEPAPPARDVLPPARREVVQLIVPVLNVRPDDLVDSFSDERGGGSRLHEALDIMAPAGTSVVAAAPGVIERLFESAVGGNSVYVRSNDRETIYYYAHLAEYAPGLTEGQKVRRGQRLGTVGSTGRADPEEPHLHFAILRTAPDAQWWEPATALNPYPLLKQK